jgi:short-subunit dehydrogenase
MDKFDFTCGTAVVTGAASGIGEQVAHALARRGSALALVDRDAERLERVAQAVRPVRGRPVTCYVTDLADDTATHVLADKLAAAHPDTSLLINNAGVALGGTFEQVSEEEFDWLLAINLRAVITMTRAMLPVLRANPGSHLVNVSSLFGLIAPAGQVAYATSKFAVRGFTEALRAELEGDVGVTVVHPGGIRTRIAETARVAAAVTAAEREAGKGSFARMLTYPPERAAEQIVAAVEGRRPRLLIGLSARVPDVLARLAPVRYPALLRIVQGAQSRPGRRTPG